MPELEGKGTIEDRMHVCGRWPSQLLMSELELSGTIEHEL